MLEFGVAIYHPVIAITENLSFDLTDRKCFPFQIFHGKQFRICGFACFIDRLIARMSLLQTSAPIILRRPRHI